MNKPEKPIEILYVEDNPADARLAEEALKEAKVLNKLTILNDGARALDYLYQTGEYKDAKRPDLLLLDLNLPKVNGRDVLARIRSDDDLRSIPVVILTTSAAQQDILEGYKLGASYVRKPLDLDQFVNVMQAIDMFWLQVVSYPSGADDE